ncbi:DNA replication factor Dna2 N-terminal domain-containing protein [Entamoeba marina]
MNGLVLPPHDTHKFLRCVVIEQVVNESQDNCYRVVTETDQKIDIVLTDAWANTTLVNGECIDIIFLGQSNSSLPNTLTFNNSSKYLLIERPDLLLNTTAVVGATFCSRKTIIGNFVFIEQYQLATLLGTLIHGVIQHIFLADLKEMNEAIFMRLCKEQTQPLLKKLYVLKIKEVDFLQTANESYTSIKYWFDIWKRKVIVTKTGITYKIKRFVASEAQIQSYIFGLKGAIDILFETDHGMLIVEMKTGKVRDKDKAQVTYYYLLLGELLNKDFHSFNGVLNYVHADDIWFEQVNVSIPLLVGVTQIRNELAGYIDSNTIPNENDCMKASIACNYCEFHEHCGIMCRYNGIDFDEGKEFIKHLDDDEINFYLKYMKLTQKKFHGVNEKNNQIWLSPNDTTSLGRNLKLIECEETHTFPQYYIYHFEGECVVDGGLICVSSEDGKMNVAKGTMVEAHETQEKLKVKDETINDVDKSQNNECTSTAPTQQIHTQTEPKPIIKLNRVRIESDHQIIQTNTTFRLDKFSGRSQIQINLATVGKLMENTSEMKKIRDILFGKKKCPIITFDMDGIDLNLSQPTFNKGNVVDNISDDVDWVIQQMDIENQPIVTVSVIDRDNYLNNTLAQSKTITPIVGLSNDSIKIALQVFLSQTNLKVFLTGSSSSPIDSILQNLHNTKVLRFADLDNLISENSSIEDLINSANVFVGTFRDASGLFVQNIDFDLAIIVDGINVDIVEALNVFYLCETVWLFEGDKNSEEIINDTKSVHTILSRGSNFNLMYEGIDKESESKSIDMEDIEQYFN